MNFKYRFKVGLVLKDSIDKTNVMIIGRPSEQLFGTSCYELVVEKDFTNQQEFPDAILRARG